MNNVKKALITGSAFMEAFLRHGFSKEAVLLSHPEGHREFN